MIQVEPIQSFDGYGSGKTQSEYYYSQGMCRTQFGLTPGWVATKIIDSIGLAGLSLINWFTANVSQAFGVDTSGIVYGAPFFGSWSKMFQPLGPTSGNGLIVDQTNRVLVAGDRYLSKWDGVSANYSAGSVAATNGSAAIVGTSLTFTSGMAGKQIAINGVLYTILSFTDATHITLTTTFTGTTGSYAYTIYMGSTEQWKDFGSAFVTTGLRQMDIYEDWVVIANANAIALLNVTDDSFNNQGMNLPSGYNVAAIKTGGSGILVGVNANSRGAVFLWDAVAIGSISKWLWFNDNIKAIVSTTADLYGYGYYVITSRGIYLTNGYTVRPLYVQMPDDRMNAGGLLSTVKSNSIKLIGKYLVFLGGDGTWNRNRAGVHLFNLETQLFEFCPVSTGVQHNLSMGSLFYDNSFNIYLSHQSGGVSTIDQLFNIFPPSAYFITEPKGVLLNQTSSPSNEKNAEAAKFTIVENARQSPSAQNNTYTVSLKIYDFKQVLWKVAVTNLLSITPNTIFVDGTVFPGTVGFEVTPLEGVNAGKVAHITKIDFPGTGSEKWTLDTSLAGGNTELNIRLSVTPFRLVQKFTFSNLAHLRDVYFDIKNKYRGKRFLLKVLFENINAEIDITDGEFIYSDQGVITS